jgi:hypothetical protein
MVVAIHCRNVNTIRTSHPTQHLQGTLNKRINGLKIALALLQAQALENDTGLVEPFLDGWTRFIIREEYHLDTFF